jgi:predicted metal-dependent peptidase
MATLEERIDTMGAKMTLRSPFISSVFTALPKHITEEGSAGTNGEWFMFGRKFCDPLTEEELLGLGLHEACHVVLGHIWRTADGYDMSLANIAQDAVINRMLVEMGFALPKGGVMIPWVTADMDWEEVYRRLKQEQKDKPKPQKGQGQCSGDSQGQGEGEGQGEGDDEAEGDSGTNPTGLAKREGEGHEKWGHGGFDKQGDCDPCPSEAKRNDIEATILTAAKMARACGDKSELLDRVIGKCGVATVPWQDELRALLRSTSRDDYSFRRANRRMISQGYYLPSLYSENIGGLAIGWDMSGSMSDEDAQKIMAEVQSIVDDCSPDWVEVAFFDSVVSAVQRFDKGEPLELKPKGGGGTAFVPVFEHFKKVEENEQIAAMVFFSDMMTNDLNRLDEPQYPVLWGNIYGDDTVAVPFGRVIRVAV